MAIITKDQVLTILKAPQRDAITAMKKEHAKLVMHVHGIGVTEYLTKIEGLENETKIALRKKFARSNKDLFADILRPTDKIFNSQGGSKFYEFNNDKSRESFLKSLASIVDGYSLTQWLQFFFIDKLITDPNGLFFVEYKDKSAYPTYKSISTIRDYKTNGRGVDWVIFEPIKVEKDNKIVEKVRVYDSEYDYMYLFENQTLTLIEEETFKNQWGYVPAFTCSDQISSLTGFMKSPIYEQVELADEYLRENSIKTLFKYHHGFPLFWQYAPTCKTCGGSGFTQDGKTCPTCNGAKYSYKKDVSDVTYLKQPESSDQPTVAPDVAGYVVPPIETWRQMTEELKMMRDMIYFSHWGTIINRDDTDKTAFEVALNTQPMQDRLNQYTNSLESTEKYFVDILGEFYAKGNYKSCSINYGRNYIIKSPNQYLTEYLDEKGKNASYSILNGKLEMYYNALYANDELSRLYNIKLMYVDPLVHNSISEVNTFEIDELIKYEKVYFNQWLSSISREDVIKKDITELQQMLKTFSEVKLKNKKNEPKEVQ